MDPAQIALDLPSADGELIGLTMLDGTVQYFRLPPGETVGADTVFVDERGDVIDKQKIVHQAQMPLQAPDVNGNTIECGLCGDIVPYNDMHRLHIPHRHPELSAPNQSEFDVGSWFHEEEQKFAVRDTPLMAQNPIQNFRYMRSTRKLRRVSQVRVNPNEMDMKQLNDALKRKMVEKMGRPVPVTLVDKMHAKCLICNTIVSLNKKFEIVHLVRHFNAWHPSAHKCAGTWNKTQYVEGQKKPLSMQDFAIIDPNVGEGDNLQCIWCGMFMDTGALAMHFHEVHPDEVEVPKCQLCLQELVINARLMEKFSEDFEITLPDEHHLRCGKFNATFMNEKSLEAGIERRLSKIQNGEDFDSNDNAEQETQGAAQPDAFFLNSRMSFGRRNKPKRHFVMPALRQAAPTNSQLIEPVTECHWRCRTCGQDILAAVISAGAIRHYRSQHPGLLEALQTELCKARLERVSNGCMELVGPSTIECLVCKLQYTLHRPYNMCRAIRHLKTKHPTQMPEYAGLSEEEKNALSSTTYPMPIKQETVDPDARVADLNAIFDGNVAEGQATEVTDEETLSLLRETYNLDFQKVQAVVGPGGEKMIVLMDEDEDIPPETLEQLASAYFVTNTENDSAQQQDMIKEGPEETSVEQPQIEETEDAVTQNEEHDAEQLHGVEEETGAK
uniref:C2H2-type domain-containing protein n=1 Tax=Steinernema glaseri TaxID=37863 RepID=A0A1I8AQ90_9BILA